MLKTLGTHVSDLGRVVNVIHPSQNEITLLLDDLIFGV